MTMGGTRARVTRSAAKAPVNETRKTDKDLAAQWAAQSESDDEATRASAAAHRATPAPVRTGTTGIPRNGAMPCWLQDSDTVTPNGDGQHTRAMPITLFDTFHFAKGRVGDVYDRPSTILGKALSSAARHKGTCKNVKADDGNEPWLSAFGDSQPYRRERIFVFTVLEYAFACQVLSGGRLRVNLQYAVDVFGKEATQAALRSVGLPLAQLAGEVPLVQGSPKTSCANAGADY